MRHPCTRLQHTRATRGEMLVETLAATLIAVFAILVLFTAAGYATKMNHDASTRTTGLQQQQELAALQEGEGTEGSVVLELDGIQTNIPARFFGGENFSSYKLDIEDGAAPASGAHGEAFYNTRLVSEAERAAFGAWPQGDEPLCWYRVSDQEHEYFAARSAHEPKTLCLVYYGGTYYKCVAAQDGSDLVADATGFSVEHLDGVEREGTQWIAVSVL